ncbi:MAG: FAD-dependent oxidoreductase [Candidatus Limnocylindrales bacterium]|jgi:glycerol-3-phosphate dehydrogenase
MRVAVVGGGVVGCAVTLALARRGIDTVLLEAHPALGLEASGTNSGILHSGFDSVPGELETRLIHRSVALREEALEALGVPVLRCGAAMAAAPEEVVERAGDNGVPVEREADGTLRVPGEWVTDPVAFTLALAVAAERAGAEVRTGFRVVEADADRLWSDDAQQERADVAIDCAGLHAHDVARLFGDDSFVVLPRKGEFLVFDVPLDRILLPVPTPRTKGVLVFPTVHGGCVAGPTAIDQEDPDDWSVRAGAASEIMAKAVPMHPALEGAEPVAAYAGLRPAGVGANYVIRRSSADRRLVLVGAIRSTGLSAALGIAEHVADLVAPGQAEAPLRPGARVPMAGPWWLRTQRERPTRRAADA